MYSPAEVMQLYEVIFKLKQSNPPEFCLHSPVYTRHNQYFM